MYGLNWLQVLTVQVLNSSLGVAVIGWLDLTSEALRNLSGQSAPTSSTRLEQPPMLHLHETHVFVLTHYRVLSYQAIVEAMITP